MRITQLSMALALAIAASSTAQAQDFSKVISFGDSLTDAGNVGALNGLPPGSSFTTNTDPVHSQNLSQLLGLGLQNYSLAGGSNYAFGGACAITNGTPIAIALPGPSLPAFSCVNSPSSFSLSSQFSSYLSSNGGVADPNALYTYWAGANDIISATTVIAPGNPSYAWLPNGSFLYQYIFVNGGNPANATAIAQTVAGQSAATAVGQVGALQAAGAKTIVVFNLPNLGLTPLNFGTANQTGATALSIVYNLQFNAALANLQDGIVGINTYALFEEIVANPSLYGFTNITGKACPASSLICGPASAGYPTQPSSQTYLFADDIHPSGRAHALLANVAYATIKAPGIVSLAPQVALQSSFAQNTAITEALDVEFSTTADVGQVRGFTTVQFGQQDIDGTIYTPGLDGDSYGLNVGATYRINENGVFGVVATLGKTSADADSVASYDGDSILFGLFGQYEYQNLYGRVSFSGGNTDMEIRRNIFLGSAVRKESGSTGIGQLSGSAELGYLFKGENFTHGPYVGAEINSADVDGYVEDGSSSTAMHFDDFDANANYTHFGYQFSGTFGRVSPFARVSYTSSFGTDQTVVRAGTTLAGNFSLPGYDLVDGDFIDWNVGASMTFANNFDGFISYRGHERK